MLNKNKRARRFFLTINQNAECYSQIEEISKKQQNCDYYLITHYKGNTQETDTKKEHKHLILDYKNPRTFTFIQEEFKGADISETEIKHFANCAKYLLHINRQSILDGKQEESIDNLITNNLDNYKKLLEEPEYIKLTNKELFNYIVINNFDANKLDDMTLYLYFGNQYKNFKDMAKTIRVELKGSNGRRLNEFKNTILKSCDLGVKNKYYEDQEKAKQMLIEYGEIFDKNIE